MPKNKTNPNVLYDQALTYLLKVNDMLEHHIKNCVFDLECKKSWQSMPVVESKNKKWWRFSTKGEVRFCSDCEKKVYQCSSNDELTKNINLNRCVMIEKQIESDRPAIIVGYIRETKE